MFKLEKNIKSTKEEIKSVLETEESPYPKSLQLPQDEKSNKKLTRAVFDPATQSFNEEVLGVR